MRFFLGLLLIEAAASSSDLIFKSGHEYHFDYEGKILSGIPQLGSQYAGVSIRGKVILQSQDGIRFKLGMKDPKFVDFNNELTDKSGKSAFNWRTAETPETQSVPEEQRRVLETPVEFTMQNGQVSNVKVSGEEPQWATNFKKALISVLKVQMNDQRITGESPIKQAIREGSPFQSWRVMEQDLVGTCENDYLYSEAEKSSLSKEDHSLLKEVHCESGKLFQVTKTRNIERCIQRSAYMVNQPGHYECTQGNCPPMWGSSSVTKYIGCKESGNDLKIKIIENEGELHQSLLGSNDERATTGSKQRLVLTQVQSQMSSLPEIQNPRTFEEIFYEHSKTLSMLRQQSQRPKTYQEQQHQLQTEESDPRKQRFAFTLPQGVREVEEKLRPEFVKSNILKMVESVIEDLSRPDDFAKTMTPSKILSLTDMVSSLTTEEIESLWQSVESTSLAQEKKELAKQMIWELVIMSGSNPSIMYILEAAKKSQVNDMQIVEAIASLPYYIRTPTKVILQELFKFIKSSSVTRTNYIKYHANMAFATILKETCLGSQKTLRFGESVFGEFCSSKDSDLKTQYIPYFAQELKSARNEEEKRNIIFTLGLIAHEDIVPLLMPYVEGSASGSSPQEQRIAIFALNLVGKRNKKQVLPILSTIVNNKYENRGVRIAALTIALDLRPDFPFFQRLATSTWYEDDSQFQKYVFAVMKNLERISKSADQKDQSLVKMANFAKSVVSLAKPFPSAISSQLTDFTAEWLKRIDVGYQYYNSFTQLSSFNTFYMKMEYFLQKLRFSPIEFAVDVKGFGNILKTIKQDMFSENIQSNANSELSQALQQIEMLPYEDTQFSMLMWTRLFGNINLGAAVNSHDAQKLSEYIKDAVSNQNDIKSKVCGNTRINLIKINNLARYQLLVPSDMGLPIITEVHMPTLAKITGHLDVQCGASVPSVSAEIRAKAAGSYFGYVSTFSPFSQSWVSTGIDKQFTMNMPTKTKLTFDQGRLKIIMAQSDAVKSGSSNVDLLHFSVKPFTVIKPIAFLDPTPLSAHNNVKYIHTRADRKTVDIKLGQALGLDLSLRMKTESDVVDMESLREYLKLYNYNPLYMKMFFFTHTGIKSNGQPTARYHDMTLALNPSSSETKEMEVDLSMVFGKTQNGKKEQIEVVKKDRRIVLESSPISRSSLQHQKLEESLEKLNVNQGYAVCTDLKIEMRGSNTKSLHYVVSAGQGRKDMERKWNVDIVNKNNPSSNMNICVDGKLVYPRISLKNVEKNENVEFSFFNKAGFGQSCEENKITVTGSTSVSQQQINRSQSSEERRKCRDAEKMLEKLERQTKKAKDERNWRELNHLQEEERREVRRESLYCEKYRRQASLLDSLKFKVEYSRFSPQVQTVMNYIDGVVEAALLPYLSSVKRQENQANKIDVDVEFLDSTKTMNWNVNTPKRSIQYKHVRIPYALKTILPLNSRSSPVQDIYKKVTGSRLYPKCTLKQDVITTFNNQSYAYHMDDCYHVAISDCSSQPSHAVLVNNKEGNKHVKVYVKDMTVEIKPQLSSSQREYQIIVDGKHETVHRNERKELRSASGEVTIEIKRTQDDILVVDTPFNTVVMDGKSVEIKKKDLLMTNKHCGLCGSHDNGRNGKLKDAKQCVTKSKRAAALSFRVQQSCSDLSEYHRQIKSNEQTCAKSQDLKTPIPNWLPRHSHQCSQSKHSIVVRGNEHCISQDPILECGVGCSPRSVITKRVGYACLPVDRPRLAELYEEKVRNGEFLPELKSMTTRFSVEKTLPLSCASVNP